MASSIPTSFDVAILGAGAAGMMAAVAAGEGLVGTGRRIAIFEKNVQPGIKVLVCGGGRCNFTNAGSVEFLIEQFGRDGRFLTPALQHLDNEGLRAFFSGLGVPSHVEHDGKVYPDSNQARSVVDALVRRMRELGVEIFTGAAGTVAEVTRIESGTRLETTKTPRHQELPRMGADEHGFEKNSGEFLVTCVDGARVRARVLLLAVGGMSYQKMGTVGDGYRFAEGLGHSVVSPRPAIVGLLTREQWGMAIKGLAVRDVEITIEPPGPNLKSKMQNRKSTGDMLFTHFGLSGPAILNPSAIVAELLEEAGEISLKIDFARHVSHERAHAVLRGWQQTYGKKRLRTMLSQNMPEVMIESTSPDRTAPEAAEQEGEVHDLRLPARLGEQICLLEEISGDQVCAMLTSAQIHRLVERIKGCRFAITGTRGFKEAMVTAGGIKLPEVNPRTMESKLVANLFLTGEVLDLTGPSGGYNLQLAFSTGHLAGVRIAERLTGCP